MNKATQTIVDEINSLLEKSETFLPRYGKEEVRDIPVDLYEDLHYFYKRTKYIFESLKDTSADGVLKRFFIHHVRQGKNPTGHISGDLISLKTRLKTVKLELENGLLFNVTDLAKLEIFSNFLESGKYLLDEGWKDAAAIMIGGVLEDKLRNLCIKNNLPIKSERGKKITIEPMNENLGKAGVYNLLKQKEITAFADIRNNAAHAHYEEYTKGDVDKMYDFVLNFDF